MQPKTGDHIKGPMGFIGGLATGLVLSASLAVLRAQSPTTTPGASQEVRLGRYQMCAAGAYLYLVDTTNGATFEAKSVGDKWKWVPDMPPVSH
jgi:hypothetical protein